MKEAMTVIVLALVGPLAQAQDAAAIQRCRALTEPMARLACYDETTPVEAATPTQPNTKVAASPPPSVTVPMLAATPSPLPAVAAIAPPVTQPAAQFGLESKTATAALDQIESQIVGEFDGWEAHTIFRLANGQVWQVSDDSNAAYALRSPKVTIRRGMFGAFYLEVDGAKRSPRVKRLR